MKIVVTGNARFLGFQTSVRPLERVDAVVEIDSLNACCDPSIKEARLRSLEEPAAHFGGWHREYCAK